MNEADTDRLWLDILRAAQTDPDVRAALAAAHNAIVQAKARGVPVDQVLEEIEQLADNWNTR